MEQRGRVAEDWGGSWVGEVVRQLYESSVWYDQAVRVADRCNPMNSVDIKRQCRRGCCQKIFFDQMNKQPYNRISKYRGAFTETFSDETYEAEFPNTLEANGMPPHQLSLKLGTLIILL